MTQAYIKTVKTPKKMIPKINFNQGNFTHGKSEDKSKSDFGDPLTESLGGQTWNLMGSRKFVLEPAELNLSTGMLDNLNMSSDRFQSPSFSAKYSNSLKSQQ